MATRVVGYIRVSTDQQADEGVSLAAQRAKLVAYCVALDLTLVDVFEDAGISAKSLERPGLRMALAMLRLKEADGLLVTKLDRLTRSVKDLGALIEDYFGTKCALLSVGDAIDTRSASGRLVLNVLMSVSQWEREATGERTREAMAHLKKTGVRVGQAPYGLAYSTEVDVTGRRKILVDERDTPAIDRIVELHEKQCLGVRAIADKLTREGFRTKLQKRWHPTQVQRIVARLRAVKEVA